MKWGHAVPRWSALWYAIDSGVQTKRASGLTEQLNTRECRLRTRVLRHM